MTKADTPLILNRACIEELTRLDKNAANYMKEPLFRNYISYARRRKNTYNEMKNLQYLSNSLRTKSKKKLGEYKDQELAVIFSISNEIQNTRYMSAFLKYQMYSTALSSLNIDKDIIEKGSIKTRRANMIVIPILIDSNSIMNRDSTIKYYGCLCIDIDPILVLPKKKEDSMNNYLDICGKELNLYINEYYKMLKEVVIKEERSLK